MIQKTQELEKRMTTGTKYFVPKRVYLDICALSRPFDDQRQVRIQLESRADFVTVDDRLLKQCRRVQATVWYGTPLAYCEKENLR